MARQKMVTIYTDGACRGNPGPGGWGAVLMSGGHEKSLLGAEALTTNNRMELKAAIEALSALKGRCDVSLFTDSEYLRRGVLEWLEGWKKRGWRNAAKKPVKNRDLWEQLDALLTAHDIEWHWVKGHSGDPGNERADQLANQAIDNMAEGTP
ncbi:MAG: ribonuclease HI [Acidiferrobacterales bacterium]|nr:ribonuclease HI [Acidiferrobacterales bacterium]